MDFLSLLLIAVALAVDAFAIAVTSGIVEKHITAAKVLKLAAFFGFFQFLMPLLGWLLGHSVSAYVDRYAHWVAFALLAFIGFRMALDSIKNDNAQKSESSMDPFGTKTLLFMAVATSIDALAVGVSFAFTNGAIWFPSVVIGLVAFSLSALGVLLGERVGQVLQKRAAFAGGVILILIGLKILLEGIFG